MKHKLKIILILIILSSNFLFGQPTNKKQIEVAQNFLSNLMKGQNEKCWKLFDKENVPNVTKEQFDNSMNQIKKDLSLFETFELSMTGFKFVGDKKLTLYSYRAISTSKNITDNVTIDIIFLESSNLIAGVQPKILLKDNTASTSKGKETSLEKDTTITIDNFTYLITGINIVHFENNEGLLAIQIDYTIPSDVTNLDEWARKEAVKFAKYLYLNGYIDKATIKSSEIGLVLMKNIGVSFLDKTKGGGYNVMVEPTDYK